MRSSIDPSCDYSKEGVVVRIVRFNNDGTVSFRCTEANPSSYWTKDFWEVGRIYTAHDLDTWELINRKSDNFNELYTKLCGTEQ